MRPTTSGCVRTARHKPILRLHKRERFILKEERPFPQPVPASYLQAPTGYIEAA